MKPFDEQFADKVREVFDQHEEAFRPGAWEALASRMHGNGRGRVLAFVGKRPWLSTAAAILIIAGGMLLWQRLLIVPQNNGSEVALIQAKEEVVRAEDYAERESLRPETTPDAIPVGVADRPVLAEASMLFVTPTPEPDIKPAMALLPETHVSPETTLLPETHVSPETVLLPEQDVSQAMVLPAKPGIPSETAMLPEPEMHTGALAVDASPLSWDISAGPMITYVEQQMSGGLGFAGGVTGRWNVLPKLAIATGMLLAYQQFSVRDMPLSSRFSYDAAKPENITAEVVANHDYELLSLDFPLNLRWKISENRRHGFFVSAGVSSLLFLQQNVTGQTTAYVKEVYDNPETNAIIERNYTSTADISASYQAFTHFDFARLLNLSFGYALKHNKSTMVIEPFVKVPLGGLGSRELNMGMGGVVLRYQFGNLD